jgi:predicted DNA binding CopG/RHH family protein
MSKLTNEEKDLVKSFERGGWKSIPHAKEEILRYQKIAGVQLRKDKRVNIRLSSLDLQGIQHRAYQEGIPYQTLIASILHKYVAGRFMERAA